MKKFLYSDWLRAVQLFRNTVPKSEIQCKKMKYSAKNENNTRKCFGFCDEISNMAGVFSRFSNKIVYIKIICFACDLRMAHAQDCMMHMYDFDLHT